MTDIGIPYSEVTPLSQLHQKLSEQGFAIVDEHRLSDEICQECKNEVWTALENLIVSPEDKKIKREDPTTYKNYFLLGQLHSMMLQFFGFSQLPSAWKLRELAAPIFASIWNVNPNQLITSLDAISFHIAPENGIRGEFKGRTWWHTDQKILNSSNVCIQGFYNLEECGPNDGCLSVLEKSNLYHKDLLGRFHLNQDEKELKENWYLISDEEKAYYAEKGCRWRFVCPPKGCFVVWDSKTIHMGTEPRLPREIPRDRLVYYICMMPKSPCSYKGYNFTGIKPKDVDKKIEAIQNQRTTTHWPYPLKLFAKKPRFFSQEISIDPSRIPRMSITNMTPLMKNLIGL